MLSWSAHETRRSVDLAGIVDSDVDPGLPAGRQLVALGRAALRQAPDRAPLDAVAEVIGPAAALDAAAVAANFQLMNRVVDATGLSVGRHAQELQRDTIELLGLDHFPHARG